MAKVWLPLWECASGDLPACCVVCGGEEDVEYLEREMECRPSWPLAFLGLHFVGWHVIGAVIGLFTERYTQEVLTKLPYCEDHYDYWEKRDHRQQLGLLILALGWILPLLATFVMNNNVRLSRNGIAVVAAASVVGLVVMFSRGFTAVRVAGVKNGRVLIADIHPDFAAAVEQREDNDE